MSYVYTVYATWLTPSGNLGQSQSTWHGKDIESVRESVIDWIMFGDKRRKVSGKLDVIIRPL
jgi:hypothetical protein